MDPKEIVEIVNQIMIEEFEIEGSLLKPEILLGEGLGLDSLDAVDLVVSIEKQFGLRIQEAEARSMTKLEDVYNYIENNLKKQESGDAQ